MPEPPSELGLLSAEQQRALFRQGTLSPVDVLRAQIARIDCDGAALNAITFRHFDTALEAARESELRYRAGTARALEGLTIAVKDEYAREGWIVTAGSFLFEHDRKNINHPVIDKLLAAGAILHVQTTAPELYLLAVTWSELWGVTRNPWNLACTPGGSSGGSAALLAGGMATLAIGSDMGGSIRVPCALTGLFGSKPSYGRIASPDPSALVPHASPGPMARTLGDLRLLQNVMAGPARGCPAVLPKLEIPAATRGKARRLALSVDQGWAKVAPDVQKSVRDAARVLQSAGCAVEEIELRLDTSDAAMRATIEKALFSTAIGASLIELADKKDRLTTYARRFVDLARTLGPVDANEAAEETLRLYAGIEATVFDKGFDALLTPTIATSEVAADHDPTRHSVVIGGKTVDPYGGWFLTSLFSLLNWMPVISVPAGIGSNGVPLGLQIATRPYEDVLCYEIAAAYAQEMPPLEFPAALPKLSPAAG
jgi:Asp-tRNA(Asn)/Glu-tRNA(Gln) amidotransferase A subunit family amidase